MEAEQRYLRTLADASSYRFFGGRLVLDCDTPSGLVALVFAPVDPPGTSGEDLGSQ